MPTNYRPKVQQTSLESACWFCAYQDAWAAQGFTTKELTREIQAGIAGYDDVDDVQRWVDTIYDEDDTETVRGEKTEHLVMTLSTFFGLTK